MVALDARDGKVRWRARVSSEVLAPPAVGGGLVLVRSIDNRVFAFGADDGKRRWVYQRAPSSLVVRAPPGITDRGRPGLRRLPRRQARRARARQRRAALGGDGRAAERRDRARARRRRDRRAGGAGARGVRGRVPQPRSPASTRERPAALGARAGLALRREPRRALCVRGRRARRGARARPQQRPVGVEAGQARAPPALDAACRAATRGGGRLRGLRPLPRARSGAFVARARDRRRRGARRAARSAAGLLVQTEDGGVFALAL